MSHSKKNIIFIPPNGMIKKQDFLFDRLAQYFNCELNYNIILMVFKKDEFIESDNYSKVIETQNIEHMIKSISSINYEYIISRGWMHGYSFCAKILESFPKSLILIKDWNFSSREEYKFLFNNDDDFESIEYIFKNAKIILSHYTAEQAQIWSKEYNTDKRKFIFFPDYCNKEKFTKKDIKYNPKKGINLVLAAAIAPTSYPEEFFLPKGMLRATKKLTSQKISVNLMVPPKSYDDMITNKNLYKDIFYEAKFNKNFNVYKGDDLKSTILNRFDFGFFLLEYTTKYEYLNKYSIASKFAFYLEAGIPMLVNKKQKALSKIIKTNNLGICFENSDLDCFRKKINITVSEYAKMVESIKKFRKTFLYSKKKFKKMGL